MKYKASAKTSPRNPIINEYGIKLSNDIFFAFVLGLSLRCIAQLLPNFNYPELFIKNADVFFTSTISGSYPDIAEKTFQEKFLNFLLDAGWGRVAIGIFYPSGEPILLHLLCCDPFAVDNHSCIGHASHLQQPRSVNNPGYLEKEGNSAFSPNKL